MGLPVCRLLRWYAGAWRGLCQEHYRELHLLAAGTRWYSPASIPCWAKLRPGAKSTRRRADRDLGVAAAKSRAEPVRTWLPGSEALIYIPAVAQFPAFREMRAPAYRLS